VQGRIKRDGGAADAPEQRGVAERATKARRPDETAEPATVSPQGASGPVLDAGSSGKHGSRVALRNWRISTRLVSLLALPVVAATTLGAIRIQDSLENVGQLNNMGSLTDITQRATELANTLQDERDTSAGPLASTPPDTKSDAVSAAREDTDRAKRAFDNATDDVPPELKGVNASLNAISRQLANLGAIRDGSYTNEAYVAQTVSNYDQLIQSLLSLSQDLAQATNNPEMINATRALAAFSAAKEYDSIQRAMISAALANNKSLQPNDWQYVETSWRSETSALQQFQSIYGTAKSEALLKPLNGSNDTITQVNRDQQLIASSEGGIKSYDGSYRDWDDEAKSKIQAMTQIETSLLHEMQQKALSLRSEAQQEAVLSGAIIVLVLGISVIGAFVVARSMIRSLRRLQDTAQDVAQRRLPELVKHLSESDPQDVDTSVESIGIQSRDEIGQVAGAFDEVHREAVRLASEQALLRGNVNAMFTNLSRRSQGLIQRQLSLISELESREADPDQLSSLFKLDHLATRMRRNGENLLVLAGEEPGRRWTRPVPLVDVLRAAASEVEQYERIELTSVPAAEVTGRVVNDLVHLLAELLENATSFSSPQTKVRVTGHALPDGRVLIEIHDTGIGLSPEDLADINERLANPPTVDVSVSRRMGLFVVGRLSLRHGIRIQLRPSDSGGTTALVMLPVDVTQGGKQVPGKGRAGAGGPGTASGPGSGPNPNGPGQGLLGGPQRSQVAGGGQRPAIGSGGPDGLGGPGGRPGAPRPSGAGAAASQRTGPSWANEQGRGRPVGPGAPAGSGQGRPQQPQPASASSDATGGPRPHGDGDVGDTGSFNSIPHTRPQGILADMASTGQFQRPQFNTPTYTAPLHAEPDAVPHTRPVGEPAEAESTVPFDRPDFSGPGTRPGTAVGAGTGFQRSDVFQRPGNASEPAQEQGPYAEGDGPDRGRQLRSGPYGPVTDRRPEDFRQPGPGGPPATRPQHRRPGPASEGFHPPERSEGPGSDRDGGTGEFERPAAPTGEWPAPPSGPRLPRRCRPARCLLSSARRTPKAVRESGRSSPSRRTGARNCPRRPSRWRCRPRRSAPTSAARSSRRWNRTGSAADVSSGCSRSTSRTPPAWLFPGFPGASGPAARAARAAAAARTPWTPATAGLRPPATGRRGSPPRRPPPRRPRPLSPTSPPRKAVRGSRGCGRRAAHPPHGSPLPGVRTRYRSRAGAATRTTRSGSARNRCASRRPAGSPPPVCRAVCRERTWSRAVPPSRPGRPVADRRFRGRPTTCADA
jgi:signal transduction histidine kinase